MKKQFVIPPSMPYPARMITTAIQSLLRVSRSEAEKIIHGGYVSVNGRLRTHAHGTLEVGDELEVEHIVRQKIPLETKKSARSPIEILYEDEQILVVCKPSHLLTVPTPHREKNTLQSFLTKRLQKEKRNAQAFCVHRLDRGVSGCWCLPKISKQQRACGVSLPVANRNESTSPSCEGK